MKTNVNEDKVCYAEGVIATASEEAKKPNRNELIVGMTGVGKTFSNVSARLLYTSQSSLVVPIAKKEVNVKYDKIFESKGYSVLSLNFSDHKNSNVGYDPLDYIKTERDVMEMSRTMVGAGESKDIGGKSDPYWNDSATNVLSALISLVILQGKEAGRRPCFADVVELYNSMIIKKEEETFSSNIDYLFERAERKHPKNHASKMWKTIKGLSSKTASCIISIVNNAINALSTKEILEITRKERKVNFKKLGEKKTILFICSAPYDKTAARFINLMYSDMFKELFKAAEKNVNQRLDIPVHIICDDFACGSRIDNFEEYISVFRAAGMSVTLLLQSESQLESMYGPYAAQTIINNCATYIYMGGMDTKTCRNISEKIDRSVSHIMSMPLGSVIVMRCGEKPVETTRYQILNDPLYKKHFEKDPEERV